MKTTFSKKIKKGFTLIELLVVIVILAAMAGVSYGILSFLESGKEKAAQTTCNALVSAIDKFKEANDIPILDKKAFSENMDKPIILVTDGINDGGLVKQLCNLDDDDEDDTVYLEVETVDEPKGGLYEDEDGNAGLYDPWGNPYIIHVYTKHKGDSYDPFTNRAIRNKQCLVYSLGVDGEGRAHDENIADIKAKKGKKGKKSTTIEFNIDFTDEELNAIEDNLYSWKSND